MKRLAIVSTHPIQYNAPFFRLLAEEPSIDLKVFYTKSAEAVRFDKDFGQAVVWDIPLTEGYDHSTIPSATRAGRKALIVAIETFQPHAVLVYGWNFPGHWATMRHFKGHVPVWFRGDSTLLDPMPSWKKALRRLLLTQVYKSVDRAFYAGQANREYFEWVGLTNNQLTYAPHAVDNTFFMADHGDRMKIANEKREALGIPKDAWVFLYVGKLEPKKQPLELVDAFNSLTNTSCHLVFVGSGSQEAALDLKCGSNHRIHVVGFQNQQALPIWYRVGNAICLPSRGPGETWGLAVNEGVASGCVPLVSDRVGCHHEVKKLIGHECCFAFSDKNQLIQSMDLLMQLSIPNFPEKRAQFCNLHSFQLFNSEIRMHLI